MTYKKGEECQQKVLFPDCIDDYVEEDAPVRLFDAFVDSLDMDNRWRSYKTLKWSQKGM